MSSWAEKCRSMRDEGATLADMLDVPLQIDPNKVAINFEGAEITYRELDEAANRVANGLIGLGVQPGDRVAVQLDNRPEFVEIFFGIMRSGAVIVPANVMYKADEMHHIVSDSGAKVLFISGRLSSKMEEIGPKLPALGTVIEVGEQALKNSTSFQSLTAGISSQRPQVDVKLEDYAIIQYTSGTTGKPKGAVVSHGNVTAALDMGSRLQQVKLFEDDVTLLVLPLFHSFALDLCLGRSILFALKMILVNRFDPDLVFSLFEKHKVTTFWGAPPMYFGFVNAPGLDKYDVSSLKYAFSGAAALPVVILERFKELTGVEIMEGYGLSETSPVLTSNAAAPLNKPGSVGFPYPEVRVRIVDDTDQEVPLGEVGEICAKGPNIFQGYWNRPEATAEAMRSGWFHTGDLGRVDEDGYYYIVDRKKDMIVVSGYNVYPLEVESALLRHPKVMDCAIVGVPDEYQGESVKAIVVPRSDEELTEREVIEYCREHLAVFKCPRHVSFLDELPKSASGKVLKRVLREREKGAR